MTLVSSSRPHADTGDTVWAIVTQLPSGSYPASDAAWHRSFSTLREEFGDQLPGLRRLEFHRSDDVDPVSDLLDEILQLFEVFTLAPGATEVLVLPGARSTDHLLVLGFGEEEILIARQAALRLAGLLASPPALAL